MRRVSDQLGSRRVATIGVPAMLYILHGTERLGLCDSLLVSGYPNSALAPMPIVHLRQTSAQAFFTSNIAISSDKVI